MFPMFLPLLMYQLLLPRRLPLAVRALKDRAAQLRLMTADPLCLADNRALVLLQAMVLSYLARPGSLITFSAWYNPYDIGMVSVRVGGRGAADRPYHFRSPQIHPSLVLASMYATIGTPVEGSQLVQRVEFTTVASGEIVSSLRTGLPLQSDPQAS